MPITEPDTPELGGARNSLPGGESPPPTPRWVKVFGIIVLVVILLVAILVLSGHASPVQHGP
jgi:hypothetical protein